MDAKALSQALAPALADVAYGASQGVAVLAPLRSGRAREAQEWKRRRGHWIEDTPLMKRLKIGAPSAGRRHPPKRAVNPTLGSYPDWYGDGRLR